jgi:hypothetical protein
MIILQMGVVLGMGLAFILGTGLHFGAKLFTKDVDVIHLIRVGIPVIYSCSNLKGYIGNLYFQPSIKYNLHSY